MTKRRSKLEVTLCALEAIDGGISKPTRIMYVANMSWLPTQEVLASLVEQGLVNETISVAKKRTIRRYTITEKGKKALEHFEGMEFMWRS